MDYKMQVTMRRRHHHNHHSHDHFTYYIYINHFFIQSPVNVLSAQPHLLSTMLSHLK
jgi:hypothetical protein